MPERRKSRNRDVILKILKQSEEALSHLDVLKQTEGLCDRVTVYRVLDRLVTDGQIHKVVNPSGVTYYAACSHEGHHHDHSDEHVHFSCEVCGKVTCLEKVVPKYTLPEGYKATVISFTMTGICPDCPKE